MSDEPIALAIAADHPAFAGHFPGQPIVPAVVLLAEALAAIEAGVGGPRRPLTLANAKFLVPVGPGTPLTLSRRQTPAGWRFEIRNGEVLVASGLVTGAAT
jgi:3-hydroxymyristoyl/3-hydroxydecanoyl-(acyl carrier protein) dehydratase